MSTNDSQARFLREAVEPYAASDVAGEPSVKISISLPADLVAVVRAAAADGGLSVSATIAAAIRRELVLAEQSRLDAALAIDADEGRAWAAAGADIHARLLNELEW